MSIEQKILTHLHTLSSEKQLIVLYLVESLARPTTQVPSVSQKQAEIAWQNSLARMKRGYHLGGQMPNRESLHER
ncbi:hypothetical protein BGP_0408 [Beggiatoa sp. PS]|nr:hypothetical protein BGP_0408 [Beggiatoa sp. PS]